MNSVIALHGLGKQNQVLDEEKDSDENTDMEEDPFDSSGSCSGGNENSYTSGETFDAIESNDEDMMAIPSPDIPETKEDEDTMKFGDDEAQKENLAGYDEDSDKPKLAARENESKRQSRHSIPRVERRKGPRRGGGSIFQVGSTSGGGSIGN